MSRSQDQQFFDLFSLVLAALVVFTFAVIALALSISSKTIGESQKSDPQKVAATLARIAPLGRAVVAGESASNTDALLAAVLPAAPAAAEPEVAVSTEPKTGEEVYNMACTACHAAGIAGAPKVGEADAWTARIAQGMDVLNDHAINGYQGTAGLMPAKGGITSLSDDEVSNAVVYMVDLSQ